MDDADIPEEWRPTVLRLKAASLDAGCTCGGGFIISWDEATAKWDSFTPEQRKRIMTARLQVADPSTLCLLEHDDKCYIRRHTVAAYN